MPAGQLQGHKPNLALISTKQGYTLTLHVQALKIYRSSRAKVKAAQQEKPTSLCLATIIMEPPEAAAQSQRSLWLWTTCAEWPDLA